MAEDSCYNYIASFVDSVDPDDTSVESNDTGMLAITPERGFGFTNQHDGFVPTGIMTGRSNSMIVLSLLALLAGMEGYLLLTTAYRRSRRKV